ncbi:hypothetical protein EWE75_00180 [Sphingomonas populi]|uniref:DUF4136 domain-containing protein n=1 Tax=Sphingomonas populi TaxID=2484750 RepID=A0A4Q6Y9Y7_9SPHN|nr:hypothetical protein [Sphingomonas populi]RZF66326.1 hypothetical protein EWE75_00180 [Sphingomonas populi]
MSTTRPLPRTLKRALTGALLATTLLAAGCATQTPYRPATGSGFARTGYSDRQIEANRFMVSFAGNGYTPRETVERYLLFRAAELTVQQGYDYFVLADRQTDKSTRTYATPEPFVGGPYGGWGPAWSYYGRGFGWRSWSPFGGGPYWDRGIDVQTIDKFEAHAEIVLGHGPKPERNVRAFDAHDVIKNLGPTIVMPEPGKK